MRERRCTIRRAIRLQSQRFYTAIHELTWWTLTLRDLIHRQAGELELNVASGNTLRVSAATESAHGRNLSMKFCGKRRRRTALFYYQVLGRNGQTKGMIETRRRPQLLRGKEPSPYIEAR